MRLLPMSSKINLQVNSKICKQRSQQRLVTVFFLVLHCVLIEVVYVVVEVELRCRNVKMIIYL